MVPLLPIAQGHPLPTDSKVAGINKTCLRLGVALFVQRDRGITGIKSEELTEWWFCLSEFILLKDAKQF